MSMDFISIHMLSIFTILLRTCLSCKSFIEFGTGFWAYISKAIEISPMAMMVLIVNGIPNIGTLTIAVITNSTAEANAFKIEFNFFRNKLVANPRRELLAMISKTKGLFIDSSDVAVKALRRSP